MKKLFWLVLVTTSIVWAESPCWEYGIPANATVKESASRNGRQFIEYQLNGQKVGYRITDQKLQKVMAEQPYLNGQLHGLMYVRHENGKYASMSVYRNGHQHGPAWSWKEDGSVQDKFWWINGREALLDQYLAALRTDRTLPPATLFDNINREGPQDKPKLSPADQKLFDQYKAAMAASADLYVAPLSNQTTQAPTNPRAATMRKVWEAAQSGNRISDLPTRVRCLYEAANEQIGYARRIFGYVGKTEFINNAAQILGLLNAAIDRVTDKAEKSAAYLDLANGWRELAKIALWGNHSNNKQQCDQQAKHFYELAVQADRGNSAAQAARTDANRPLPPKPVPPPVFAQAPPVPEPMWNAGGDLRQAMLDGRLDETMKQSQGNFMLSGSDADLVVDTEPVTIQPRGYDERLHPEDAVKLKAGQTYEIGYNDTIVTGATGKCRLVYYDRSVFHIRPNAVVTFVDSHQIIIRRDSFSSGNIVSDLVALFDSRTIRTDLRVTKEGHKFLVITPTAVTGCRGTCVEFGRGAGGQESVKVYDGAVEVRTENDVAYLAPGNQATLKADTAPQVANFQAPQRLAQTWPEAGLAASNVPGKPVGQQAGNQTTTVVDDDGGCFWMYLVPNVPSPNRQPTDATHDMPWAPVIVQGIVVGERYYDPQTGRLVGDCTVDAQGRRHGIIRGWHSNGKRGFFGTVRHGKMVGSACWWDTNGDKQTKHVFYWNDQEVEVDVYEAEVAKDPSLPPACLAMYCNQEPRPVNIGPGSVQPPAQPQVIPPPPTVAQWPVQICWTPGDSFCPGSAGDTAPFGTRTLVAQLTYPKLKGDSPIQVVWTVAGNPQPLLSQSARIAADGKIFQAVASLGEVGALAPGQYQVRLTVAGQGEGVGQITISPPPAVGNRNVADVYTIALNDVGAALQAIRDGNGAQAAVAAQRALPPVSTTLANAPELPDVQSVWELMQAVVALGKVMDAANRQQREQAAEWGERLVLHARYAAQHANEALFKQSGQELVDAVAPQIPQWRGGG